jgi:hypothetical protein
MKLSIREFDNACIAILESRITVVTGIDDAIDLLGNASFQGATGIITREEHFCPEFFDLSTRMAGNILQKFSNYRMKLAIIGDFSKYTSKSLRDFIYESNKGNLIFFTDDLKNALKKLS